MKTLHTLEKIKEKLVDICLLPYSDYYLFFYKPYPSNFNKEYFKSSEIFVKFDIITTITLIVGTFLSVFSDDIFKYIILQEKIHC